MDSMTELELYLDSLDLTPQEAAMITKLLENLRIEIGKCMNNS